MKNRIIMGILTFFMISEGFFIYKSSTMTDFALKKSVFVFESGTDIPNDVEDYVNCSSRIKDSIKLNLKHVTNTVGTYKASATYLTKTYHFTIKVIDTTKPKFTLKQIVFKINQGGTLYARQTVKKVQDMSTTSVYFLYKDDSTKLVTYKTYDTQGSYIERVVVKDEQGNISAPVRIKVVVADNVVPPVLKGVTDIKIALNSNFDTMSGISAKDDVDGNVTSKILVTGVVDTAKKGTYTLTYTVSDSSLNMTKKTRKVVVQ